MRKTILVDQDDVLADFVGGVERELRARGYKILPRDKMRCPHRFSFYPDEARKVSEELQYSEGFFLNLEPIEGAFEGLENLRKRGHNVYICSAPMVSRGNCPSEKYGWAREHLGIDWAKRLILTKDKTMVYGDILLDDKDRISGSRVPSWEHVVYEGEWNLENVTSRRFNWKMGIDKLVEK